MKKWYTVLHPACLWDAYWGSVTTEENLRLCNGDQVLSVFHKYLRKDQVILEAGCGLAKWVIFLNENDYRVIGLDSHHASLKRAKTYERGLRLAAGSATALPVANKSVDVYISLGVIEHFEEGPARALREAHRVLKPGGVAIIETPLNNALRRCMTNRLWTGAMMLKKILGHEYFFAEYRFTADELKDHIGWAGFAVLEVRPKDYALPGKSIGLYMDLPILRRHKGATFELNLLGRIAKRVLNAVSPWIASACVVCVAAKSEVR